MITRSRSKRLSRSNEMDVDLPDVNIGRDPNELYVTLQADVTQPTGLQILPDHVVELDSQKTLDELIDNNDIVDQTNLFHVLLAILKNDVLMLYPPGSGKTILAETFTRYLMLKPQPTTAETSVDVWLRDRCKFRIHHENVFAEYLGKIYPVYITFEDIKGDTVSEIYDCVTRKIKDVYIRVLRAKYVDENGELFHNSRNIKFCLQELVGVLTLDEKRKVEESNGQYTARSVYVILDAVDTMLNRAVQCRGNTNTLVSDLIQMIASILHSSNLIVPEQPASRVFIFGVSHMLSGAFPSGYVRKYSAFYPSVHDISEYFSYPETEMRIKLEAAGKLTDANLDACKAVSKYTGVVGRTMFNPYYCAAYIDSLIHGRRYSLQLIPPSIWAKWVFMADDLKVLLQATESTINLTFDFEKRYKELIYDYDIYDRKLFYPLFIYGGYLSCVHGVDVTRKTHTVTIPNNTSRAIIGKIIEQIFLKEYHIAQKEAPTILQQFESKCYQGFCDSMRMVISKHTPSKVRMEKDYMQILYGIWVNKYFRRIDAFDTMIAGVAPDMVRLNFQGDGMTYSLLIEGKQIHWEEVKLTKFDQTMNFILNHRNKVLTKIKTAFKISVDQLAKYLAVLQQNQAKPFHVAVMIFFLNVVVMFLATDVKYTNTKDIKFKFFCSEKIFTKEDVDLPEFNIE